MLHICILHQKLKEIATSSACASRENWWKGDEKLEREECSGERSIRQVAWGTARRRIARTKIRIRRARRRTRTGF